MADRLDIVNKALQNLGESTIVDLNDKSARSVKIQKFYNEAIRETLRAYRWSFAERTIKLDKIDYESNIGNLPFAYLYPENVVAVIVLFVAGQDLENLNALKKNRKRIHNVDGKKIILSNVEEAHAIVTYDESSNEEIFDDIFVSAVSYQLAAAAAISITGDAKKRNDMISLFQREIETAASVDGNENNIVPYNVSSFEEERYN